MADTDSEVVDTTEETTTSNVADFGSNMWDGMKISVGLSDGEVDTIGQRAGMALVYGTAGAFTAARLLHKPALKRALNASQYAEVVNQTPGGKYILGK